MVPAMSPCLCWRQLSLIILAMCQSCRDSGRDEKWKISPSGLDEGQGGGCSPEPLRRHCRARRRRQTKAPGPLQWLCWSLGFPWQRSPYLSEDSVAMATLMSSALRRRAVLTSSATSFFFFFSFSLLSGLGFLCVYLFLSQEVTPPPGPAAASMGAHQPQPLLTSLVAAGRGCVSETETSGPCSAPRTLTRFPCPCKPMAFPRKTVWKLLQREEGTHGGGWQTCSGWRSRLSPRRNTTASPSQRVRAEPPPLAFPSEESGGTHRGGKATSP